MAFGINNSEVERIAIFDPTVCSQNLGDEIIKNYVLQELRTIFPGAYIVNVPTQERISKISLTLIKNSNLSFVAGTNLLTSEMNNYRQWQVGFIDSVKLRRSILLMGVGWWQYQNEPNFY